MTDARTSLLTAEDLALITEKGAPYSPREDLAIRTPAGEVLLTLKGRQFYARACTEFGVSADLSKVSTVAELDALESELIDRAHATNEAELLRMTEAGEVPGHLRETLTEYFHGDLASWGQATRRREQLREAGPTVVGVTFNRKGRDA